MKDKFVLITGSTDGIGKQTAVELATLGFNIIVHGKNEDRVSATVKELEIVCGANKIEGFVCDLSSLNNVRKFADEIKSIYPRLDVLINNAGVFMKKRLLTVDGFEMTFAVNHLAHFLLTNLLLDLIKQSHYGKIINVSSMTHQSATIDWNNLNGEINYDAYAAYSNSKLANVLFTKELAEKLMGTGVTSNSLHPGVVSTKLLRAGFSITGSSVKKGAETSAYLASSENVKNITGEYFVDCAIAHSNPISYDFNTCKKFWRVSAKMTGL